MTLRSMTTLDEPTLRSPELWKPRAYMKRAVEWLVRHAGAALFQEPGLGKTAEALYAAKALMLKRGIKKVLVVAPLRVCYEVWTHDADGEIGKWSCFTDHFKEVLLHGEDKLGRLEALDGNIYVINFEGLQWLEGCKFRIGRRVYNGIEYLIQDGVDTLIVDELSWLKHMKSKRFRVLKPYLGMFKRRWGLTGSPASNGLIDLFGQLYVVDLGKHLGGTRTWFKYQYFVPTGFRGQKWVPAAGAEKLIYKAIAPIALSMRVKDHLDLPPLLEQNVWVSLPDAKTRKIYDELEDELFTRIDEHEVIAANAAVASSKCRQVASGGLYVDEVKELDDGSEVKTRKTIQLHAAKTEALEELIEGLQGEPILVMYEFLHDLARIRKAVGAKVPVLGHGASPKVAAAAIAAWNKGDLHVLIGHPRSMGHGLNLQSGGHHVAWYSPPYDYDLYDQTNRRLWRRGQKDTVIAHRILARDTVDAVVAAALSRKKRDQNALFAGLIQLAKKRRQR